MNKLCNAPPRVSWTIACKQGQQMFRGHQNYLYADIYILEARMLSSMTLNLARTLLNYSSHDIFSRHLIS